MNPTAKSLLLFGSLGLLGFGILCLKQNLNQEELPPAFIPGETAVLRDSGADGRGEEPTILSAEPGAVPFLPTTPSAREVHPLTFEEEQPVSTEVPVGTPAPDVGLLPLTEPQARAAEPPRWNTARPVQPAELLPPIAPPDEALATVPADSADPATPEVIGSPATPISPAEFVAEERPSAFELGVAKPASAPRPAFTAPPPDAMAFGTVVAEADDSLWRIAAKAYGGGEYYKALYLANRDRIARPDRIAAGTLLRVPPLPELRQQFPEACPAATSEVPAGK